MKLGIPQRGYGIEKNIPSTALNQSIRVIDRNRIHEFVHFKVTNRINQRRLFTFTPPYFPKVDLLHFFNSINYSKTNWVVTFESLLPYWQGTDEELTHALNQLTQNHCLAIIAMSHHAISNLNWRFNQVNYPLERRELIRMKTTVLYPPEPLRERRQSERDAIRFVFVAREFYKKGGLAILRALKRILRDGDNNWAITMVGDLNSEGDQSQQDIESMRSEAREIIYELGSLVQHHNRLQHSAIIEQMQRSHYLIHPTLQDTFGYVITESMSCGCVPIACAIRTIPEFVSHDQNGYLIKVKTDENDNPKRYISPELWADVESQLHEILLNVLANHHQKWSQLSHECQNKIAALCDPQEHAQAIHEIYAKHQSSSRST